VNIRTALASVIFKVEKKIFRSRISVVLMGVMSAAFISASVPLLLAGAYAACAVTVVPTLLIVIGVSTGFRYVITGDRLCIKIFRAIPYWSIDIPDIVSVRRSYNPLSSPAASLKRLCLRFNKEVPKWMKRMKYPNCLVSPVREQEFLDALKSVNPDIDIQVSDKQGRWRFWDWDL
jgi:hypothetical protein